MASVSFFSMLSLGTIFPPGLLSGSAAYPKQRIDNLDEWLAAIICVSTVMDYAVARGLDGSPNLRWRRWLLGLSLVANLGLLVYFKYANFFLDSLEQTLNALGASSSLTRNVLFASMRTVMASSSCSSSMV